MSLAWLPDEYNWIVKSRFIFLWSNHHLVDQLTYSSKVMILHVIKTDRRPFFDRLLGLQLGSWWRSSWCVTVVSAHRQKVLSNLKWIQMGSCLCSALQEDAVTSANLSNLEAAGLYPFQSWFLCCGHSYKSFSCTLWKWCEWMVFDAADDQTLTDRKWLLET